MSAPSGKHIPSADAFSKALASYKPVGPRHGAIKRGFTSSTAITTTGRGLRSAPFGSHLLNRRHKKAPDNAGALDCGDKYGQ
jgi:hypothetical protein